MVDVGVCICALMGECQAILRSALNSPFTDSNTHAIQAIKTLFKDHDGSITMELLSGVPGCVLVV